VYLVVFLHFSNNKKERGIRDSESSLLPQESLLPFVVSVHNYILAPTFSHNPFLCRNSYPLGSFHQGCIVEESFLPN